MEKHRIYILKTTFPEPRKRDLIALLFEAGYTGVQMGSEPVPGRTKARRTYLEFWTEAREAEEKP